MRRMTRRTGGSTEPSKGTRVVEEMRRKELKEGIGRIGSDDGSGIAKEARGRGEGCYEERADGFTEMRGEEEKSGSKNEGVKR